MLPDLPDDSAGVAMPAMPQADAFTRLQAARDGAAAIIRSAFNAFLTDLTRFDFVPGTKEIPNADHALPTRNAFRKARQWPCAAAPRREVTPAWSKSAR